MHPYSRCSKITVKAQKHRLTQLHTVLEKIIQYFFNNLYFMLIRFMGFPGLEQCRFCLQNYMNFRQDLNPKVEIGLSKSQRRLPWLWLKKWKVLISQPENVHHFFFVANVPYSICISITLFRLRGTNFSWLYSHKTKKKIHYCWYHWLNCSKSINLVI